MQGAASRDRLSPFPPRSFAAIRAIFDPRIRIASSESPCPDFPRRRPLRRGQRRGDASVRARRRGSPAREPRGAAGGLYAPAIRGRESRVAYTPGVAVIFGTRTVSHCGLFHLDTSNPPLGLQSRIIPFPSRPVAAAAVLVSGTSKRTLDRLPCIGLRPVVALRATASSLAPGPSTPVAVDTSRQRPARSGEISLD